MRHARTPLTEKKGATYSAIDPDALWQFAFVRGDEGHSASL